MQFHFCFFLLIAVVGGVRADGLDSSNEGKFFYLDLLFLLIIPFLWLDKKIQFFYFFNIFTSRLIPRVVFCVERIGSVGTNSK